MSAWRFAGLTTLAVVLLQAAWIVALSPFRGTDEIDHAYRASAVAHGEWMPGPYTQNGRGRLVTVPEDLVVAARNQCEALEYLLPDNCVPAERVGGGMVRVTSGAATYSPAYYWLVGIAGLPFTGNAALYAMRAAAALLCAIVIGAAAWSFALKAGERWRRVGFLMAMVPVFVFSTVIPAANGLEIAAGLALWSSLLSMRKDDKTYELPLVLVAGTATALLGGLRGLGPGFAVLIVGFCLATNWAGVVAALRRRIRWVAALMLLTICTTVGRYAWNAAVSGPTPLNPDDNGGWNFSVPFQWQFQTFAVFPLRNELAPGWVYPVFGLLFIGMLVLAFRQASRFQGLVLVSLILAVLLVPAVLTALTYESRGAIWQGRYGLALAVGVPLLAASLMNDWAPGRWRVIVGTCWAAFVIIEAASILKVRGAAAATGARVSELPGVPAVGWVLLAVSAAGVALWFAVVDDRPLGHRGRR